MPKHYSNQSLQKASFKNEDLSYARFYESDLRGADFTDFNLTGADFSHVKTGITPRNTVLIFVLSLAVSLLSGYVAMLAGHTVQLMLHSRDANVRMAGVVSAIITLLFIVYFLWIGAFVKQDYDST